MDGGSRFGLDAVEHGDELPLKLLESFGVLEIDFELYFYHGSFVTL